MAEPNKKEIFQGQQLTVDYKLFTRVNMRQYATSLTGIGKKDIDESDLSKKEKEAQ